MDKYISQYDRRRFLIRELITEDAHYQNIEIPNEEEEQKQLLRALMNVRPPKAISDTFLKVQNTYLKAEISDKGITDVNDLQSISEGMYLWQGDITTLKCDVIVNAANSKMTGCFVPNHRCIDNCIHSFSGVQLREDCVKLMDEQGHDEPTGQAKITKAYNLPSRFIIHTVGPIISGDLTEHDCDLLASCYRTCLELAEKHGLESIAFCCISTGEFRFPNKKAAEIAVKTVKEFQKQAPRIQRVIFNVFKDEDFKIYHRLLHDFKRH